VATPRIADSVGRVLGDRYRLTRPLGVGASAHVFVAEDVDLRRRVAIKVLHPGLAGDEAFGRRFQAEARVAAALRHPNVLRVYDWGYDDGDPYLVMELLEGGSLRALLDRGHLLSLEQAAAVGADVARALDYAHRRGLVHRDIKPANLIFDDEGRIAVADFGLARALAEATWTEPAGAVVGTARYAAPEAVRGESLDSRADVYALALVLIEATTGSVPFAADTTLATLLGRLEQPVTAPPSLGVLGPVLEAAGTPNPADRLDAQALTRALDGVAGQLPPPAPLPLAGPAESEAERDRDPTDYPGRPRLFDGAQSEQEDFPDGSTTWPPPGGRAGDGGRPSPPIQPAGPARRGGHRRWLRRALVAGILAVVIGAAVVIALRANEVFTPSQPVPSLIGSTPAVADQRLRPLHLRLAVSGHIYDSRAPAGTIVSQQPATGRLKQGDAVAVTLSLGPRPVPVPSVTRLTSSAAGALLGYLGLRAKVVARVASMTVPAGAVVSSNPDHGTLLPGQTVALVISTGKPTVPVPALQGPTATSFAAARAALAAVNLTATEVDQYSDTVPAGQVVGTNPPAGTAAVVGTQVTVVISRGPHLVVVPDVAGQSVGAASQILGSDGFQVSGVTGNPIATVTGTSPLGGALVRFGSAVQIITG
jgi:serine/threonine-protein kinase